VRTRVTRAFTFDAAHQLPWHAGKCQRLHGHTYRLEVSVEGPLDEHGIVWDFADLDEMVRREVLDRYDHRYLNDLLDNPTAELLATQIWEQLEAEMHKHQEKTGSSGHEAIGQEGCEDASSEDEGRVGPGTAHPLRLTYLKLWETSDSAVELWP